MLTNLEMFQVLAAVVSPASDAGIPSEEESAHASVSELREQPHIQHRILFPEMSKELLTTAVRAQIIISFLAYIGHLEHKTRQ